MPVFFIFSCEVIVFSFLISAFMNSLALGVAISGASGFIMYLLFQRLYSSLPLVWGATLLGGLMILLWASYIDMWLGTTFIAIFLSLLGGTLCYFLNRLFFQEYQI